MIESKWSTYHVWSPVSSILHHLFHLRSHGMHFQRNGVSFNAHWEVGILQHLEAELYWIQNICVYWMKHVYWYVSWMQNVSKAPCSTSALCSIVGTTWHRVRRSRGIEAAHGYFWHARKGSGGAIYTYLFLDSILLLPWITFNRPKIGCISIGWRLIAFLNLNNAPVRASTDQREAVAFCPLQ